MSNPPAFDSFPQDGFAVVCGATGGIGKAFVDHLQASGRFSGVIALSRSNSPALDFDRPETVAECADYVKTLGGEVRLIIDATGYLHDENFQPEKSLRQIDADYMAKQFQINAIGPALLMKHFCPMLPRSGKSVFATLSAKVGSIGDNRMGGWYGYRAAKAALNQLVKCTAIEIGRNKRDCVCVALHPGTVDTGLSGPFAKSGLKVQSPVEATANMLNVIDQLDAPQSGGFFAYDGTALPW
ncbi:MULTISPECIES: SDR family oxidoreductase [unclassified Thalassospira]|uniref:SDR family oxidoreductase n=1 Tax=unclassified Thalassospira TaxID=2648997 RepID=UPI0007A63579|nr:MULTISPECIES: SDR family oxidoreductase [unclassified Thalassospira]KZC97458.1 C-factor [Thalassospira sp. MCCC 1A02898]ONH85711.1 C factor [Thalassospira sp. MCCC 1A02803]